MIMLSTNTLMTVSDVEAGGETAFPRSDRLTVEKSRELVERLGEAPPLETQKEFIKEAGLSEGSWEERLTLACYAKFAVPPRRGDAILFYSQRPDGRLDETSLHGACPVLKVSQLDLARLVFSLAQVIEGLPILSFASSLAQILSTSESNYVL